MATVVLKSGGGSQAMSELAGGQSGTAGGSLAAAAAATAIARDGSTSPSAIVKASAAAVATGAGDPLSSATASSVPKGSLVPTAKASASRARAHRARARHRRGAGTVSACAKRSGAKARRSCVSEHRAAAITKRAKRRFVYLALLKNLTPGLFCHHGFGALKDVENLVVRLVRLELAHLGILKYPWGPIVKWPEGKSSRDSEDTSSTLWSLGSGVGTPRPSSSNRDPARRQHLAAGRQRHSQDRAV